VGVGAQRPEQGVADAALEGAEGLFRGLARRDLLVVVGAALAVRMVDLVIAVMWMAWFTRLFPRRDSRQTLRFPEDTSTGAVLLQAAKWSRPGNRDTSSTSPSTIPAMTGPTPNTSVSVVPEAFTAAASFFFTWLSWASMRRRSSRKSRASSQRASVTAPDGTASSRSRAA
jgi:hypothetical protein